MRVTGGMAWVACALAAGPSVASDIQIRARDCRSPVELSARDARLSDVFARLAKVLDFQVRMEGVPDPLVTLDLSAPAPQLVAALAAEHGSFMIRHVADARCHGARRVSVVWLTPKAQKATAPGDVATAAAPAPSPASGGVKARPVIPMTETATKERLRQVEEEARRRKEAYEIYVRRHGKPPPPEPEE